ncbi:cell growth regulator with RING finger domain protein 1-like [Tubulanus polymorphus]|uniref:cell growth regulator with RING finger domain protein 1-like n=1 Tax=Tubulanus polymorphus TaxID=672921 RepID=UPI003DA61D91
MSSEVTKLMYSFMHLSNFLSISAVLICLALMFIFIVRINGEHNNVGMRITRQSFVPAQDIVGIFNPFEIKFPNLQNKSLSDGVHCSITTKIPCYIQTFWGAVIDKTHWKIRLPWRQYLDELLSDSLLNDQCIIKDVPQLLHSGTHHMHLQTELKVESLGQSPRARYPLVIIMSTQNIYDSDSSVISLISILHLKDSVCDGASHLIYSYIKSNQGDVGHLCSLQQLYVSDQQSDGRGCVVCCNGPVFCALLPCRHTCVCKNCFSKLDRCPMCRSLITSFFSIEEHNENPVNYDQEDDIQMQNLSWMQTIELWNQRVNEYFGFV